jgi:hypothetical protein
VRNHRVSIAAGREQCAVVLEPTSLAIDAAATQALRDGA